MASSTVRHLEGQDVNQAMNTLKKFWLQVAHDEWRVQDFGVWPDPKTDPAHYFCIFHAAVIHAHVPALRMKGQFSIHFRHSVHNYEASFRGDYNYVGRGAHRDACLGTLTLASLSHLGLLIHNDGILPEKIHICQRKFR